MADEQTNKPGAGDDSPPPTPDGAAGAKATGAEGGAAKQKSAAEALAAEALKAAQQAVANLKADSDADEAEPATGGAVAGGRSGAKAFSPPPLEGTSGEGGTEAIDLLTGVNLNVKIELGRTRMFVEDVLKLRDGAVVELDKLAGDPVDVYVNDRPVARGEVLILNDNFCVRINEILSGGALDP